MIDWLVIDKVTIFKGEDESGNRYLNQFLADYKRIFNPDMINAGCQRCLEDYYTNFIKFLQMGNSTEKKEYVLKKMYNGIPLEFGSAILVTNANITKEYAEKLIKNHPRGEGLFDAIPKREETTNKKADKKKSTPEE